MIEHLLQPLVSRRFNSDLHYRDGHLRVVNALPTRRVIGLHIPQMKQLAKEISRKGCEVVFEDGSRKRCLSGKEIIRCFEVVSSDTLCHEECVVWGYLINSGRYSLDERLSMLESYIPILDNWAVCDSYCSHAKWMAGVDKRMLWSFLKQWYGSNKEFEVRFAIVVSMCYFLTDEWLDVVFKRVASIDFECIVSNYKSVKKKPETPQQGTVQGISPYYVRMGVAWLLATALAKYPDATRRFVSSSAIPYDVVKLYKRKARESFRTRYVDAL